MVNSLTVLKFGSSVLPDEESLGVAVKEIQHWVHRGHRVVAVVSALGGTTDELLDRARRYGGARGVPDEASTAALLATGELTTVALLGLALTHARTPAGVLDSAAIGLSTVGPLLDARASDLDRAAVHKALASRPVLVIPGFLGRDELARTTLLGRGGSDLTALFLAGELHADQCVLVKDVDGLYDSDPAVSSRAKRYLRANYEDVLRLAEGIVQHKAVRYARERRVQFTVAAAGTYDGTLIWGGDSLLAENAQLRDGVHEVKPNKERTRT